MKATRERRPATRKRGRARRASKVRPGSKKMLASVAGVDIKGASDSAGRAWAAGLVSLIGLSHVGESRARAAYPNGRPRVLRPLHTRPPILRFQPRPPHSPL